MRKHILLNIILLLLLPNISLAEQTITSTKVIAPPIIDGNSQDETWGKATEIITHDNTANLDIAIKSVHTNDKIYFLVTFSDDEESRDHKNWDWDSINELYKMGPQREDIFIFKWNMEKTPVDLSLSSDDFYKADIWFWKACRTDPIGYADDKLQTTGPQETPETAKITSKSGKTIYLQRLGDQGTAAYKNTLYPDFIKSSMPHFEHIKPTDSRADVKAKGTWKDRQWTIEFERNLTTGHLDDISFDTKEIYQFGISRYEIAGRTPDPETSQPLFGTGDISETLFLKFSQ